LQCLSVKIKSIGSHRPMEEVYDKIEGASRLFYTPFSSHDNTQTPPKKSTSWGGSKTI
jgi:hypothetical protein